MAGTATRAPLLSIIVPSRGRPGQLRRFLEQHPFAHLRARTPVVAAGDLMLADGPGLTYPLATAAGRAALGELTPAVYDLLRARAARVVSPNHA